MINNILSKTNLSFLEDSFKINKSFSIYFIDDESKFIIKENIYDEDAVAFCKYESSLLEKGWDFLILSSYSRKDGKYPDEIKSFAMGYLEGVVTSDKIWLHYLNQKTYFYSNNYNSDIKGEMPSVTRLFLEENAKFIREMGKKFKENDRYWQHAYLIHVQLEGMLAGYNSVMPLDKQLSLEDLNILNAGGDLEDIENFKKENRVDFSKMSHLEIKDYFESRNHCSALIKIAADLSNVWFGHNTWTNFSSMLRIFKEYKFVSNNGSEKSKTVAFSSYPGSLSSIDDFYITDTDLYVTETTNQVFNNTLFDTLTPNSLLSWHRSILANRLSDNSKGWTEIFAKYNSGTYNNQFQILDLKLINTERKEILSNAFWIIEQIPSYTEAADLTSTLKYGYWPSYNSAYFPNIRRISGYDEQLEKHPELKDAIDYATCARAKIFRRDHNQISNLDDYKRLLRYNDFENDVFSKKDPGFTISCRRDLDKDKPDCRGATDAKVASINDIKGKKNKKIRLISGPTYDQQPVFDSGNAECIKTGKYVFNGLPKRFDFPWIDYETQLMD